MTIVGGDSKSHDPFGFWIGGVKVGILLNDAKLNAAGNFSAGFWMIEEGGRSSSVAKSNALEKMSAGARVIEKYGRLPADAKLNATGNFSAGLSVKWGSLYVVRWKVNLNDWFSARGELLSPNVIKDWRVDPVVEGNGDLWTSFLRILSLIKRLFQSYVLKIAVYSFVSVYLLRNNLVAVLQMIFPWVTVFYKIWPQIALELNEN